METLLLPMVALLLAILILIVYFGKKKIHNEETRIYSKMLIVNFIYALLAIFIFIYAKTIGNEQIIALLQKIYMISMLLLIVYINLYNMSLIKIKNKKMIYHSITITFCIIAILIFIAPLSVINVANIIDGYGLSYNITLASTIIYLLMIVISSVIIFIKNKDKFVKDIPFICLIFMYIIGLIIRKYFPSVMFENFFFTFMLLIMYFTIENPDMKMLQEIKQSKEFAEQANNEKAMFLYNMSQEIKNPVKSIENMCEELLSLQDINEITNGIKDIKFTARKLSGTINGVLDIPSTMASNIEIKNARYNAKILFKEIISITKVNIKDKNLEFRVDIDDAIPEYLIGDSIRLKQVINTIMNNAIKHTDKGFIEFNVNTVIKHDICRLIMTIEDSGKGIESKKLETLFYNTDDELDENGSLKESGTKENLSVVKILTNLIGGTVIVNSELGKGSKFTVVLDQQIAEERKTQTDIAIEKLSSNKRILVVDDEEESLKQIAKILNKYDVNVDTVLWGQDCLEKIRKKQKYDLILLDEDMPRLNGIKTFEKLKLEEKFNIPVIIMITEQHLQYKDRYTYNGFSGCIVKPVKKNDLSKILKKHLKIDD